MRNTKTGLCILFLVAICVIPSAAFATLMPFTSNDGKDLIRDSLTGEIWIANMEQFSSKSYQQVGNAINLLNDESYGGINSWELASLEQVKNLFASINTVDDADLFGLTYDSGYDDGEYGSWGITSTINRRNGKYYTAWLARYPDDPNYLEPDWGGWYWGSDGDPNSDIGAWVKTAEYAVPEPMTVLLLGFGMLAIASFRRQWWRT